MSGQSQIKKRLKEYSAYKGLNGVQFSKMIGVSNSYIYAIRKSISPSVLHRISEIFPDLNIDWLATGRGEMIAGLETRQPVNDRQDDSNNTDHLRFLAAMHMLSVTSRWEITDQRGRVMMLPKEAAVKMAIEYTDELIKQLEYGKDEDKDNEKVG